MLGERFYDDGKSILRLSEIQQEARREFLEDLRKENSPYTIESYLCECGAGEEDIGERFNTQRERGKQIFEFVQKYSDRTFQTVLAIGCVAGSEWIRALFYYSGNRVPLMKNCYEDNMELLMRVEVKYLRKVLMRYKEIQNNDN